MAMKIALNRSGLFNLIYVTLIALGILVTTPPRDSSAQILVDQHHLSVPFIPQNTLVWCWVAAAKMAIEASGRRAPSQCEMLQRQYGVPCCDRPDLCFRGGYFHEIAALVRNLGGELSSLNLGNYAPDFLNRMRQTNRPIVAHVDGGHFVVITGMEIYQTQWGYWAIVTYHDPYYGPNLRQDWPQFVSRMSAFLMLH